MKVVPQRTDGELLLRAKSLKCEIFPVCTRAGGESDSASVFVKRFKGFLYQLCYRNLNFIN